LVGAGCGLLLLLSATWLTADTLVMRSGDRVNGTLLAVNSTTVEFRERGLFGMGSVRHYDLGDVERIELDRRDREGDRGRDYDRDRGRGSDSGYERDRARPRGNRERDVDVAANVAWTDTGVEVRRGDEVTFEASGKITWGKDRRDDADGESGNHYNANRPIPRRPGGALIAKIGRDSNDYFFIGKATEPIRMPSSGRLFLGINDDYLPDNSGGFRVNIVY
jgi:hypothetical protein